MAKKEEEINIKLNVSIYSKKGSLFNGEVDFLLAPGVEGILGIMPGHTTLISLLKEGDIVLKKENQDDHTIAIKDGLLQINRESVDIIATV